MCFRSKSKCNVTPIVFCAVLILWAAASGSRSVWSVLIRSVPGGASSQKKEPLLRLSHLYLNPRFSLGGSVTFCTSKPS